MQILRPFSADLSPSPSLPPPSDIMMFKMYELIDTNGAVPIPIDYQQLEEQGVDIHCFTVFIDTCFNNHTLQVYDHPGDSRCGGFYYMEGGSLNKGLYRAVAESAFNWYHTNVPEGSGMELKEVNKMSCSPDCYPFYHITFTVINTLTKEEKTLQAQLIELGLNHWQLGMLRDATHDRVLAAIRFTQAPTGDHAAILSQVLEDVCKKILLDAVAE